MGRTHPQPISNADLAAAFEKAATEGLSFAQLAEQLGRKPRGLQRRVQQLIQAGYSVPNLDIPKPIRRKQRATISWKKFVKEWIISYKAGESRQEFGERVNISGSSISKRLRRFREQGISLPELRDETQFIDVNAIKEYIAHELNKDEKSK